MDLSQRGSRALPAEHSALALTVPRKRQYVHQLDKWGMFKYKSRARAPQRRRAEALSTTVPSV